MNIRDLSFDESFDLIQKQLYINQRKVELRRLHTLIPEHISNVNTILEIGIRDGGNLCLLSRFLGEGGAAIGIDPQEILKVDIEVVKSFIEPAAFIFYDGLSQDYNILGAVYDVLKERKIDILFIDGDHKYEAVKKDFEMYSPLVGSPGMIILHDVGDWEETSIGTTVEYWYKELRKRRPYVEIVSNPPICGLGVVYV